ncbi:hypothetical protein [Methanimicrococcus hongohii]|uniref:hypothetical protein n=1 Tax=Methanimicrococcus hongohii TaxID=3028295 RepID=UPI00292CD184|nr:hypothetical protein [Methanimicrococcus sp. Hf6]
MLSTPAKCRSCNCLCCQLPAKSARLQLSFCVAAAGSGLHSACICSFLRNPFAFANVSPLPFGFCFRLPIRFPVPLADQVRIAAAGSRSRCPPAASREPPKLFKKNQKRRTFV